MLEGKTLLITGGTGSFGSTAVKRFLETGIKEVRIFSRDEKKQENMRFTLNNSKLNFYLGDIRSYDSINQAMAGVDYVFHAAALKQVPSSEFYPLEAVKTNILGAENVLKAGKEQRVSRLVLLSTDKAVYPINAMGLSKAMMEKLMIAKARLVDPSESLFCATRYGNVMASRGSVIPLFVKLIKQGKPLTITDPNMTRFLMSLEDSLDLVMFAFENAEQGDIFIQKAPASTVNDLATAIKDLFNSSSPVEIIGTRHGEKLFESLLSREEMAKAIDLGKYYRIPSDDRDLNYAKYFTEGKTDVSNYEAYTSHNTQRLSINEIKHMLLSLDYIKDQLYD